MDKEYSLKQYDVDFGAYHHLLKACGYEHLVAHNLMLVFAGIALIAIVWIIMALKDLIGVMSKSNRPFMKRRHGKWCNNFALRFFYEFFLEFCIVVLINLTVVDFSEASPTFSYIASIALLVLITGLCLFTISLLCCNGPYINGYYEKGTAIKDTWGARPLNPDFDAESYLEAN